MAEKKEKTLEQNMSELEEIIRKLEKGDMPLNEAFETYKSGMDVLMKCNTCIDKVEHELTVLESEGI